MLPVDQRTDLGGRVERMADTYFLYPLDQPGFKLLFDRVLDQEARGRRAALPIDGVDHEYDGVERTLQIRIVENDDRILSAELEMHAFECTCALARNLRARAAFTDESDSPYSRVFRQCLAGVVAEAVDGVQD